MSENEEKKESCKLQQFQRNRYFYGKLMTVRDFELEQEYFNGKRHLLNRLVHGKGLVCGFSRIELFIGNNDEVRIRFRDGGVALDSLGREIVVPVDMEKKVIDKSGKALKISDFSDTIYLYLRYIDSVSELVRAASSPLSCEEISCPNRSLEDFEVIASPDYPKENKIEGVSCLGCLKSDETVFFAAFRDDFSFDEAESNRRYYVQVRREEAAKKTSATGLVFFRQPTQNSVSSDFIDPKLGTGPLSVQLGLESEDQKYLLSGNVKLPEYNFPAVRLGTVLDSDTGRFRVYAEFENETERGSIQVRWWAFKADLLPGIEEVEPSVTLKKYRFTEDPEIKVKLVENGLSESGGKNCMDENGVFGGDCYATVGNEVALSGNPHKRVVLIKEQDAEVHRLSDEWEIGGGWVLKVEKYYYPEARALLKLYFDGEVLKEYDVSGGTLISYSTDLEDEKAVPLFLSYVDSVSVNEEIMGGSHLDLKYTWAVAQNVRIQDLREEEI